MTDFYKNKADAIQLLLKLISKRTKLAVIQRTIEDNFGFSDGWTKKQYDKRINVIK